MGLIAATCSENLQARVVTFMTGTAAEVFAPLRKQELSPCRPRFLCLGWLVGWSVSNATQGVHGGRHLRRLDVFRSREREFQELRARTAGESYGSARQHLRAWPAGEENRAAGEELRSRPAEFAVLREPFEGLSVS